MCNCWKCRKYGTHTPFKITDIKSPVDPGKRKPESKYTSLITRFLK